MPTSPPVKVPIVGKDLYSKQFKKLVKSVKKAGDSLQSVGRGLTTGLTAPLTAAGLAATKLARDLNKGLANVGTLIPEQGKRLEKFKKEVQALSVEVAQGTDVITEGLYETISAFGDAEDPMKKLTVASKAGAAGMSTTTEAMKLLSAVTKGYNDTSDKAFSKASDLAFMTVKLGQTTFPELAASMGKSIPIANSLNVVQEELFASYATLTGVTGNAAEVSTQLTSIMSAMVKPSAELTRVSKKLGYASASTMVKQVGLVKSLELMSGAVDGNTDKMAKLLGRKEALTAALALTGSQAEIFTSKFRQMEGSLGATDKAFKAQSQGINKVGFEFEQAKRRMVVSTQRVGDVLLPIFAKLMEATAPWLERVTDLSEAQLEMGVKIAGIAAAVGPAIFIVGKLVTSLAGIAGAIGGAGGAVALLTGPVGWVTAAVIGLVGAVIYLWEELQPVRQVIGEELRSVFEDIIGVGNDAGSMFSALGGFAKELTTLYAPFIAILAKLHLKILFLPLKWFITNFKFVAKVARVVFKILGYVGAVISGVASKIREFLQPALDKVSYFFELLAAKIRRILWPLRKLGKYVQDLLGDFEDLFSVGEDEDVTKNVALNKTSTFDTDANVDMYYDDSVLKGMEATRRDESKVLVSFKDMPTGVRVSKEYGPAEIEADTGSIMEGGL